MSVELGQLRAFVAVAHHGALGRAAGALGRTQPALSARLASLEDAWSTRLFRRGPRGMSLTPEGARLLPKAEALLQDLEELERAAGAGIARSGALRLGAGDALGRRMLPLALARLIRESPGLEVRLVEGPGPRLLDELREGAIDVALVVAPPVEAADFDLEPVVRSPVVLLARRATELGRRRSVPLARLVRERLIGLQSGSAFRTHVERQLAAGGLQHRPAVEVGNLSLVRRFVRAGLGVAPVPAVAFGPEDLGRELAAVEVRGMDPVTYHRASRRGAPVSRPTSRLLELLAG